MVYENIAAYCESKGIKQSFIAEKTGMTPNVVSQVFRGERKLLAEEFVLIAKALGKSINDFAD